MNIINLKRKMTQYYLDWGATLALFKEIQAHKVFKPKAPPVRTPFLAKNLSIFFSVYCSNLDWVWMSLMGLTKLLLKLIWLIRSIILM